MKLFSIFGNPVKHSISPRMHNLAFKELKIDGAYIRTFIDDGNTLKEVFNSQKLDGANVTVPHKEIAFKLCDEVRGLAKEIGAVNTLVKEGNKIIGYNTDAPGFMRAINEFGTINTALVLGAGGTAKAISLALKNSGIKVAVLNRSANRLEDFKNRGFTTFTWDEINNNIKYDLIINTTSAGLKEDILPAPKEIITSLLEKASYSFDVIYNKPTSFLTLSKEMGLTCKDGADMLLYQGVLAFNLFFDNELKEEKITQGMKKAFTL